MFTKIFQKKKFKVLVSTGEVSGKKITIYSLLRFLYALTFGFFLERTKFYIFFEKLFGKPFTADGLDCKIGLPWYPEKDLGEIVVKYPDGADIKKKNYPYNFLKKHFDIFLTYTDIETSLIKKSFPGKLCQKIDYFRYKKVSNKKKTFYEFKKNKLFKKNKKILYWLPTHIDHFGEKDLNIELWYKKFCFLKDDFNIIIRPHPKTLLTNKKLIKNLNKSQLIVDLNYDRKIGDLIKNSDVILCDYGGTVFSSLYLKKSIIFLNSFKNSKFDLNQRKIQSMDVELKEKLFSININDTEEEIKIKICLSLKSNYKKKIYKLKKFYFGNSKPYTTKELSNYLLGFLH